MNAVQFRSHPSALPNLLTGLAESTPFRANAGKILYDFAEAPEGLFLVEKGIVVVSRRHLEAEVVMRVCRENDWFGEQCLIQSAGEQAQTVDNALIRMWPANILQAQMQSRAEVGAALVTHLSRTINDYSLRVHQLANQPVCHRLASLLIQLKHDDTANEEEVPVAPLPHKVLAQYVGTSREVITQCLIRLRKLGMLDYSRSYMRIRPAAIQNFLLSL